MTIQKSKFLKIFLLTVFITSYQLLVTNYSIYPQDNADLISLTKQLIESRSKEEAYPIFEKVKDTYLGEGKYNEFVDFLKSLTEKKKDLEPFIHYYLAFARYRQLKHLEDKREWEEYFKNSKAYRAEVLENALGAITQTTAGEPAHIYARLLLWKFYKERGGNEQSDSLEKLTGALLEYSAQTPDIALLKIAADELLFYGEDKIARQIYELYVKRLIRESITADELKNIAMDFYKKRNIPLSESVFDVYVEKVSQVYPKEKLIPVLIEVARIFSWDDTLPLPRLRDIAYAENIFKKIEIIAGFGALDDRIIYLRAFNLERIRDFAKAKDSYLLLAERYPQSPLTEKAIFKAALIFTYILKDREQGKIYFEKLANGKQNPYTISALYQLGLLAQWEGDALKPKEYYSRLIEESHGDFYDTVTQAQERLKEIDSQMNIEHNLKTFLDVSFKEEAAGFDMTKLDLNSNHPLIKKDDTVTVESLLYIGETGCLDVKLKYLWSGHLGTAMPSSSDSSFNTTYANKGVKEINLVVISPSGIIDRGIELVEVE